MILSGFVSVAWHTNGLDFGTILPGEYKGAYWTFKGPIPFLRRSDPQRSDKSAKGERFFGVQVNVSFCEGALFVVVLKATENPRLRWSGRNR